MNEKFFAVLASAVIAVVLALIFQSIHDAFFTLKYDDEDDLKDDEVEYEFTDEDLYPGCLVYDTLTGEIVKYVGIHLGEDNDNYATVVTTRDNAVHYYHCLFETILHVKQK